MQYKNQNLTQQIKSHAYFEAFKNKPRTDNSKVLQFCCDYTKISKKLMKKRKLDKYTQLKWFFQGFSLSIQFNLFNHYNINLEEDTISNFESILLKTYSFIKIKKNIAELGITNVKNNKMSNLVDKSIKKILLKHPFFDSFTFLDLVFYVFILLTAPLVTSTSSKKDKKIDNFIDIMQNQLF